MKLSGSISARQAVYRTCNANKVNSLLSMPATAGRGEHPKLNHLASRSFSNRDGLPCYLVNANAWRCISDLMADTVVIT